MSKKPYIPKDNSDERQAEYLFCLTHNDLLCAIVNDQIDTVELAKKELAQRGYDHNGNWIGFHKK